MGHHLVVDGNAVYEIDEECIKRRMKTRNAEQLGASPWGKTGRNEAYKGLRAWTGKEGKNEAKSS